MAAKILLSVLINTLIFDLAFSAPASEPECVCYPGMADLEAKDLEELWAGIKEIEVLSNSLKHPIIAGQLPSNIPCSACPDIIRRKRRIIPEGIEDMLEVIEDTPEEVTENEVTDRKVKVDDLWMGAGKVDDRRCPIGTVRRANWCVPEEYDYVN